MQQLIDLGTSSPRAMSPERMSNECARLLLDDLRDGNFALNDWQLEFIVWQHGATTFTLPQKKVIYNMAHKFRIL